MKRTSEYILVWARWILVWLLAFAIGKLCFMFYNYADNPFGVGDVFAVLWHGLRMDLSTTGYLLALPLLSLLASVWVPRMSLRKIIGIYFVLVSIFVGLTIWADMCMYEYWGFKLNAVIFSYMTSPEGATNSVSLGYILSRVLSGVLFIVILSVALWKWTPRRADLGRQFNRIKCMFVLLFLAGVQFLFIRGGIGTGTMNVGEAYYSQRLFLNHSAVNPVFSLISSFKRTDDFSQDFNYYPDEELPSIVEGLYPATPDVTDTLLNTQRPQVLFVMMESFGGKFIEELGGIPGVAPQISRLIPEGIFFDNYYSNSFRTDRGTVSLYSGWLAYPTASLMRLPEKLDNTPGLAKTLAAAGYDCDYLYGGDIKIMGKKGYLISTGFKQLTYDKDFSVAEIGTDKWGANDSVSTQRVLRMIAERPVKADADGKGQWMMGYQTLSSHEPFDVPYHRLEDIKLNAFAFTDNCIGQLIDGLKQLPVWDNLLVVIVPDHGFLYDLSYQDPEFFHSPMLWLGGAVKNPRRVHTLMNQSDVVATLLAQLGIAHDQFPWSRNVFSKAYTYPFAYSTFPSGVMFKDSTGVTVYDITSEKVIADTPSASADRLRRGKAILQHSYDKLQQQ